MTADAPGPDETVLGLDGEGIEEDNSGATTRYEPVASSDATISLDEARLLTSRYGGRVAVLMGEAESGKTTIWVELWTEIMAVGHVGDIEFAGSNTSLAFEERSLESRLSAGVGAGDTVRSRPTNDGFLHMRVARPDGRTMELFFADFAGEHFQLVREGTPLLDELPWIRRADRVAVVVDGDAYADLARREIAINRATRQLYALRASNALSERSRLAILLTKLDRMNSEALATYESAEAALIDLAKSIDSSTIAMRIAARPVGLTKWTGLDSLLEWLCNNDRSVVALPTESVRPERAMERFRS